MKLFRITSWMLLAAGLVLPLPAAEKADASWEKLKSLAGDWEGTYEGKTGRVSYKLVSNGTALMETMEGEDASQMISIYHPDGSSLLMTHYCSIGNQPRMRSKGLEGGRLAFSYVDAANLKGADDHVMKSLVLGFPDADHLVQEWTSKQGAQEHVARFEFKRRK